jgi:transposase-like protein
MKNRKNYDPKFKAKVAFEAAKEEKTIVQFSSEYGVHTNHIGQWKKKLLKDLPVIFENKSSVNDDSEEKESELYRQIGQLKVELDWLKKKSSMLDLRRNGR